MRYLDDEWIQGPHDIEALIPMYRSYNLDDSIIYLYSILPYVDTGGAEYQDFFQGGRFADFRLEEDVERGRDPFHEDGTLLPPYMTPLSLLGNHQRVNFTTLGGTGSRSVITRVVGARIIPGSYLSRPQMR